MFLRGLFGALSLFCLVGAGQAETSPRVRRFVPPISSSDEAIYVSSTNGTTALTCWPVLKFAQRAQEEFSNSFMPIGSRDQPVAIVLGSETNGVTQIERRTQRLGATSQLLLFIPAPETVDLDLLRTGVIEALIRSTLQSEGKSYAALTWPAWFIQGMADASRNQAWKSVLYERFYEAHCVNAVPTVEEFFSAKLPPSLPVSVFFATWVKRVYTTRELDLPEPTPDASEQTNVTIDVPTSAESEAITSPLEQLPLRPFSELLTMPWKAESLGGTPERREASWKAYQEELGATVFVPGELTLAQYERWLKLVHPAMTPKDAQFYAQRLMMQTVGRPAPMMEVAKKYALWYVAIGKEADSKTVQAAWDAAQAASNDLLKLLKAKGRITMEENGEKHE